MWQQCSRVQQQCSREGPDVTLPSLGSLLRLHKGVAGRGERVQGVNGGGEDGWAILL